MTSKEFKTIVKNKNNCSKPRFSIYEMSNNPYTSAYGCDKGIQLLKHT